jgi:3-methyladenine DNA glycosylase/8-oxoguanine DNA glycosylase
MPMRTLHLGAPIDLRQTLGPLKHGSFDPCIRLSRNEAARATRTPEGPATIRVLRSSVDVETEAWGPGAGWILGRADDLIGAKDDPAAFRPRHPVLSRLHRSRLGLRIPRTHRVVESLVPTVISQKVTSEEARRSWCRLARAYGEPAPGPGDLLLPPDPALLAALPYYEFHRLGIERRRADIVRNACHNAAHLEKAANMEPAPARALLKSIPGVGPWTAGCVTMLALGDPDAVILGDYHIPHIVSWVLAGEPRGDDVRMLELLRPYKGQRGRVIRLLKTSGFSEPAFGPRHRLRSIERI